MMNDAISRLEICKTFDQLRVLANFARLSKSNALFDILVEYARVLKEKTVFSHDESYTNSPEYLKELGITLNDFKLACLLVAEEESSLAKVLPQVVKDAGYDLISSVRIMAKLKAEAKSETPFALANGALDASILLRSNPIYVAILPHELEALVNLSSNELEINVKNIRKSKNMAFILNGAVYFFYYFFVGENLILKMSNFYIDKIEVRHVVYTLMVPSDGTSVKFENLTSGESLALQAYLKLNELNTCKNVYLPLPSEHNPIRLDLERRGKKSQAMKHKSYRFVNLSDVKVRIVKANHTQDEDKDLDSSNRHTKRAHIRRGHFRYYLRSDKSIYIAPTWVGAKTRDDVFMLRLIKNHIKKEN